MKYPYLIALSIVVDAGVGLMIAVYESRSCSLQRFAGGEFMVQAASRGIPEASSCKVYLADNEIHGLHDGACEFRFVSRRWLNSGWVFKSLTGEGANWQKRNEPDGLTVEVDQQGGFRLVSITVENPVRECRAYTLAQVLAH